jgi:hypothetical protein
MEQFDSSFGIAAYVARVVVFFIFYFYFLFFMYLVSRRGDYR